MSTEIDAQEILRRTAAAYRLFDTYQDSGYLYSIHNPGRPDERHSTMAFRTTFQRPNLFRFEWRDKRKNKGYEHTSVIWCDGLSTYEKYFHQRKATLEDDLDAVIASATGSSHGTAHTIAALLMDNVRGEKLTARRPFEYVDDENLNGEECHRLRHEAPHEVDVWISTSRSVILKLFEQYDVGNENTPYDILVQKRFKSLRGFISWLKFRHQLHPRNTGCEPFHVIDQTFYTDVKVNATIPKNAFTLEGQ
ncbi:MAG: hypothetical protein JST01_16060 [Cyanobacteria bacterium SZAS TMP-1]|nr:hypothetical protein [Cyanobacteria bacterium SZAS TMP-1]